MHLFDEEGGAANELLANSLLPVAGSPAARSVVQVATVRPGILLWFALVPVIDVLFRRRGVVLPLRSFRLQIVVVVHDVLDHGDATAVTLADEVTVLVPTAG